MIDVIKALVELDEKWNDWILVSEITAHTKNVLTKVNWIMISERKDIWNTPIYILSEIWQEIIRQVKEKLQKINDSSNKTSEKINLLFRLYEHKDRWINIWEFNSIELQLLKLFVENWVVNEWLSKEILPQDIYLLTNDWIKLVESLLSKEESKEHQRIAA